MTGDQLRAKWDARVGGIGFIMGLLPHLLHHAGFLVGSALIAGVWGTALSGALGFLLALPFLLRLRNRFGTWRAPAIGMLIFTSMYLVSVLVVGPVMKSGN